MIKLTKEKVAVLGYCIIISFILLLICTKSSLLYTINDWADPNCYFTMGKSMFQGKVIYRDLLDHKGPYIYFLYGIASLISGTSFKGVFLLQIISWSAFLYINYKICILYITKGWTLFLLPLLAAGIMASESYGYGGSAEEFCLPLLAAGLYFYLEYFKDDVRYRSIQTWKLLVCGILAGIIFWIKFNLLGFYAAWMLIFLIADIIQHDWAAIIKHSFIFLLGMLIASVPWLVYFGINGAFSALWSEYFFKNIFVYGGSEQTSIVHKLLDYAEILKHNFRVNYSYFLLIFLGFCYFMICRQYSKLQKSGIFLMCGFSYLLIYIGRVWNYYALPLSVFAVLGIVFVGRLAGGIKIKFKIPIYIACLASCLAGVVFSFANAQSIPSMGVEEEELFQYEIRDLIGNAEDNSLLLYGFFDLGLYTLCDIEPSSKYFFANNLTDPERENEWDKIISEKKVNYVITNEAASSRIPDSYELIYRRIGTLEDREVEIFLYERKDKE